MKTRICFMVSLIALLSFPLLPARAATALLHCEAEMLVRKNVTENAPISLHANAHYFFEPAGKGYVDIVGTIQTREKAAHLDRIIYFTYARAARDGFYTVKFTHSRPKPLDNTPQAMLAYFYEIGGETPGYPVDISKLNENLILFSHLSFPTMLCQKI
ncbi:TPA: FidL-like protein [Serratia rubidaea]